MLTPEEQQLADAQQLMLAREAASAHPLPGPLLDAFLSTQISAAGLTLQPIVASQITLLKRIESPILLRMAELAKPVEERMAVTFTDEDIYELLFIFSRPIGELRALFSRIGREAFREAALEAVGDKLPPLAAQSLEAKVWDHFAAAFDTAVGYRAPDDGSGTVFTPPPAVPVTGSAGGSTS